MNITAPTAPGTQRIFTSDNTAGPSPEIVQAVTAAAAGQDLPYGADRHTASARARFADIFGCDVDVLPVSTGTSLQVHPDCVGDTTKRLTAHAGRRRSRTRQSGRLADR